MIKIICVGKIKEQFYKDAIKEYQKRLSKYTKLEIIEVKDESFSDLKKTIETEGKSIEKHIEQTDFIITLEIDGTTMTSIDFSKKLDNILSQTSNIIFIIGGSYGLCDTIKERANFHLSFSKMTFPHQLFRVVLLEQIYRAFKILNNESYHK